MEDKLSGRKGSTNTKLQVTHSPCRTSGWKKLLALMALSLVFNTQIIHVCESY